MRPVRESMVVFRDFLRQFVEPRVRVCDATVLLVAPGGMGKTTTTLALTGHLVRALDSGEERDAAAVKRAFNVLAGEGQTTLTEEELRKGMEKAGLTGDDI
eukprot:gene13205-881_t